MLAIANAAVSKIADLTRKESIITMHLKNVSRIELLYFGERCSCAKLSREIIYTEHHLKKTRVKLIEYNLN
jgi:hypothetical protein